MFSKKATKIDKIFTIDLTLCSKCQIDGEDFVDFCGLLNTNFIWNDIYVVLHHHQITPKNLSEWDRFSNSNKRRWETNPTLVICCYKFFQVLVTCFPPGLETKNIVLRKGCANLRPKSNNLWPFQDKVPAQENRGNK